MSRLSLVSSFVGVAVVSLGAACAPAAGARTARADGPCPGGASLVVNNSTGDQVEIVHTRNTGGRALLTVVGPGRHEIDISGQTPAAYFAQRVGSKTILAMSTRPQSRNQGVSVERVCHASS